MYNTVINNLRPIGSKGEMYILLKIYNEFKPYTWEM